MPHLNLRANLLAGFGVVLLCSLAVNAAAYVNTLHNFSTDEWVRHTQQVLTAATNAELTIESMESSYRDYLLTGNPASAASYRQSADSYAQQLEALAQLTSDNPPQADRWRAIQAQTEAMRTGVMEPGLALRQRVTNGSQRLEDVVNYDAAGSETSAMAAIRARFAEAIDVENRLLAQRTDTADQADATLLSVLVWGTLVALLLGLSIARIMASHIGDAMHRLVTTARAIAQGDLGRRIDLKRNDEIGQAAAAFDSMAAKLQQDIVERERIQLETDSILNSAAEGIYSVDALGRAKSLNPAALRLTGYTLEEVRGADLHSLIHHSRADGTPLPREECTVMRALADHTGRQQHADVYWRKDGSSFPVEYAVVPIVESGTLTGAVVSFHDISERLAVARMKDEFISVVSHELRTPLTSIRGSLGLLAAGLLGPISDKAKHMLGVALSNTDRLIRLINDILDIERIESGHIALDMRVVDARELVLRCLDIMKPVADEAHVLLTEQAETLPLRGDPDRLLQTLTNLVSNAIKFSPRDASVAVTAYRDDGSAHFTVHDRGRGIPPDKLHTIFGRFEQVDASDSREKGGTGLGLAISRSIVQQHGGRIWVESVLGQGSTFHVVVPIGSVQASGDARAPDSAGRTAILVVDDDPDILEIVGGMLENQGYRPLRAATGQAAITLAAEAQPAAILLDLAMPGMNGWETLHALKAQPRTCDIPVLIVSGMQRDAVSATQAESQMEGWLAKPVTPEKLREMLTPLVGRQAGPARILIVEDDADLAGVMCETFAQRGVQTESAATNQEAVDICGWYEPDLLLLDLALPGPDGFEVVEWFRRHDRLRRVALVVYTARDLEEHERERLHLGPTEHLTKSRISTEEVQRRVLSLLERIAPVGEQQHCEHQANFDRR